MIKGGIIEKTYNKGKTNAWIEIWETTHYFENISFWRFPINNILSPNSSYWDSSSNVKYPAFVIHFNKFIVHSKEYSFRIPNITHQTLDVYPISWKAFGSSDNQTWFELADESKNDTLKTNKERTIKFPMKDSSFSWFKFQFTESSLNNFTVYISQFELYGTAIPIVPPTCNHFIFTTIKFNPFVLVWFCIK